ncbi:uncharacterized protein LOC110455175 [Mizuhopecten yessoensis]|uniref:uncharacterized protein LOC110455175 n=1 Tax=Mizuhopecten yessoensis TaxID=6573 RepID=UPI000B45A1DD|nr:uncharacterized protein LOC110455175 [Mizuhopecten yessoensis]
MSATTITPLGSAKSKAYVSIFDFGGEIMFSNFQHIFLNTNNVILLCFSLHNVFEEEKILDRIYFWLNFLSTFADEDIEYCPPVILVGTHLDKVPENKQRDIKDRVKAHLLKETKHATAFNRHVLAFEVVANGEDEINDAIRKIPETPFDNRKPIKNNHQHCVIWKQIFAAAEYQSQWNHLLPAKWLLLERELMILKGQGKKVMTLEEIKDKAKQLSVPLEDDDVIAMLRYLHGTRSILCFQLDHPDDKVVLDIKFVVEAFRLIVTDIKFHEEKPNVDPSLLQEYGKPRLTMDFIRAIWKPGSEFHLFMDTLLFYLERLELIVKPLPKEGETNVDYFLVPYLLDEADPSHIRRMLLDVGAVKSATLCFDFLERFIPPAVYNKILASCIHKFALFAKDDGEQEMYLQQGLACFVLSPRWKMILHCKDSRMKITLFSNTTTEIKAGDGYSVRCIMEAIIKETLERNKQGHMKFQYFISADFEVTRNEETVLVKLPARISSPVDAEVVVWCPEQNQTQHPVYFSGDILDTCLTTKQMSHVAKFIGLNYALLFVELGMLPSEIDQIYWSFRECLRTLVTYLLVKWSNKLGKKADKRLLLKAMKSQGFNTDDIMEHLHEMGTAGTHRSTSAEDDRCPTESERLIIAKKINLSYVIFFLELDLDIETIDRARMDHERCIDRFLELMRQWVQDAEKVATLAKVYEACKECSMNSIKLRMEIQRRRK